MAKKETAEVERGAGVFAAIVTALVTKVSDKGGDIGADFHFLAKPEGDLVLDQMADLLVRAGQAVRNIFRISIGGNRTTEQVVVAGGYNYANPNINSKLFPMRRRAGKRDIVLVPMPSDFTLEEALAKLVELNLDRPTYEDGLFLGEQHPEKQMERPIMFPHEPVVVGGVPGVVDRWSRGGGRRLNLDWAGRRWDSFVLVAGVRKS